MSSGTILFPTSEHIIALDSTDKSEQYRISIDQQPTLPPAVSSDVLLLVTGKGLYGYDLKEQTQLWKLSSSRTYTRGAAPVAFLNHFVVQDGNRVRCVESSTGSVVWERSFDPRVVGFAATSDVVTVLRMANQMSELVALDTGSGSQIWAIDIEPSQATPVPGEQTYTVSESGRLSAVEDGEVAWETETEMVGPKAISTNDEYVFLGPDDSGRLIGINKTDRTVSWQTKLEFASIPLATSESLFVPTANDGIVVLDFDSGETRKTYRDARYLDYLAPYNDGVVLSRQPNNRLGFMEFPRS